MNDTNNARGWWAVFVLVVVLWVVVVWCGCAISRNECFYRCDRMARWCTDTVTQCQERREACAQECLLPRSKVVFDED